MRSAEARKFGEAVSLLQVLYPDAPTYHFVIHAETAGVEIQGDEVFINPAASDSMSAVDIAIVLIRARFPRLNTAPPSEDGAAVAEPHHALLAAEGDLP